MYQRMKKRSRIEWKFLIKEAKDKLKAGINSLQYNCYLIGLPAPTKKLSAAGFNPIA